MTSSTGPSSLSRGACSRGFTLLELLFVTIIMLAMIGVSTPLFRNAYDAAQLDDATRNVTKLMQYARERAIIERAEYRIRFDLRSKEYRLEVRTQSPNQEYDFREVEGKFGRINRIPEVLSVKASRSEITFYPDGDSDDASVWFSDKNGRVYTLTMLGARGHVQVLRYDAK